MANVNHSLIFWCGVATTTQYWPIKEGYSTRYWFVFILSTTLTVILLSIFSYCITIENKHFQIDENVMRNLSSNFHKVISHWFTAHLWPWPLPMIKVSYLGCDHPRQIWYHVTVSTYEAFQLSVVKHWGTNMKFEKLCYSKHWM